MFIPDESAFGWAIEKALLIVVSGFSTIIYLAWMGSKKIFHDSAHGKSLKHPGPDEDRKGSF
jgi:hypothetical protein